VKIGLTVAARSRSRIEKKRTGQDRTGQSKISQGGNISPIWGESPTVPIETKICLASNLAGIITCAKFQDDIFRGYNFTVGRIPIFLLICARIMRTHLFLGEQFTMVAYHIYSLLKHEKTG